VTIKDTVQTIQAVATILALIIGGIWSYNIFVKERKSYPHANIEQKVSHIKLSDTINLLRIGISLTNTGTGRLILQNGMIRLQQILPVAPCTEEVRCAVTEVNKALKEENRTEDNFNWTLISERIVNFENPLGIEPTEKDDLDFEFAITSDIKVIRIYCYFRNEHTSNQKYEIGWSTSMYYKFEGEIQQTAERKE